VKAVEPLNEKQTPPPLSFRDQLENPYLLIRYKNILDKLHGDKPHTYTDNKCPRPWNVVKVQQLLATVDKEEDTAENGYPVEGQGT
jgi:hypothetical protein